MQRRLRAWVIPLAEASAPDLHTAREGAVSEALAPEYANIRAAVSYALAAGEPDEVGRLIGALYPFLISRGRLGEAREWIEAVLTQRDKLSERGLAEALVGGGEIARFAGDLDRAVELKEELTAVDAELQRPNWRAATLADLAEIELDRNDLAAARRYAGGAPPPGPVDERPCASASWRFVRVISTRPSSTDRGPLALRGGSLQPRLCARAPG